MPARTQRYRSISADRKPDSENAYKGTRWVASVHFGGCCCARLWKRPSARVWLDSEPCPLRRPPAYIQREEKSREGSRDLTGEHHGHHDTSAHRHRTASSLWRGLLWPPTLVLAHLPSGTSTGIRRGVSGRGPDAKAAAATALGKFLCGPPPVGTLPHKPLAADGAMDGIAAASLALAVATSTQARQRLGSARRSGWHPITRRDREPRRVSRLSETSLLAPIGPYLSGPGYA